MGEAKRSKLRRARIGLSRRLAMAVALGAAVVGHLPAAAAEESARAFFQGKQIRFYTMGSPGGGYDAYMRALIPHAEKKLGAKLIPTNEPGAGGLVDESNAHRRSRRVDDPACGRGNAGDGAAL